MSKGQTMTTQSNNKPVKTLRDGTLKASIWLNEYEERIFYTVSFARSYKKSDGTFADAHTYTNADLLRLARLSERAHEAIREMSLIDRQIDQMRDEITDAPRNPDMAGAS